MHIKTTNVERPSLVPFSTFSLSLALSLSSSSSFYYFLPPASDSIAFIRLTTFNGTEHSRTCTHTHTHRPATDLFFCVSFGLWQSTMRTTTSTRTTTASLVPASTLSVLSKANDRSSSSSFFIQRSHSAMEKWFTERLLRHHSLAHRILNP